MKLINPSLSVRRRSCFLFLHRISLHPEPTSPNTHWKPRLLQSSSYSSTLPLPHFCKGHSNRGTKRTIWLTVLLKVAITVRYWVSLIIDQVQRERYLPILRGNASIVFSTVKRRSESSRWVFFVSEKSNRIVIPLNWMICYLTILWISLSSYCWALLHLMLSR